MKKLCIITINLNNLKGLQKTVNSVLQQSFKEFDYVVIDGGSNDGSADFIKEQKNHFSYSLSEPDNGIYQAMNKGIKKANAEYLLFLNSGDYLKDDSILEQVIPYLKEESIVYGDLIVEDQKGEQISYTFPDQVNINYLIKNYLPHPSSFFHHSVFEKVGLYNEKDALTSDWQTYMLAIFRNGMTYKHIDLAVSVFNLMGQSTDSDNLGKIEKEKLNFLIYNTEVLNQDFFESNAETNLILKHLGKSRVIKLITRLGFLKYLKTYLQKES